MEMLKEEIWNGYLFSTDKSKLDEDYIHQWISEKSYWAQGITKDLISKSIQNSVAFGIFDHGSQIGFARMITDSSTFAYLADVFVDESYRGRGLSKHLMTFIFSIADFAQLRRIMLGTRDAHSLYEKFGFKPLTVPDRFMEIARPDIYKEQL
jgi:GNAT superfamily N-acetyltransferase